MPCPNMQTPVGEDNRWQGPFLSLQPMRTSDFDYELPQDRIAVNPLSDRSSSQLLLLRNGEISDKRF